MSPQHLLASILEVEYANAVCKMREKAVVRGWSSQTAGKSKHTAHLHYWGGEVGGGGV